MADATNYITESQLISNLQNSYIDEGQKKELEALIPSMTDEEKEHLLSLINQAAEEGKKVNDEYHKSVNELNEEARNKMSKASKEQSEKALKKMEEIDGQEVKLEVSTFDTEVADATVAANTNKKTQQQAKSKTAKKGHSLLKLFFILIFLSLLGGGAIFALQYLSSLE